MVDNFSTYPEKRQLILRIYPDPMLHNVSDRIEVFDNKLNLFAQDMISFMIKNHGVGLAAPQVGIFIRIITVYIDEKPICLVNPEILNGLCSDGMIEGCLSIPDEYYQVIRRNKIEVRAKTVFGKYQRFWFDGFAARIIQHEVDHLNGILIRDCGDKVPKETLKYENYTQHSGRALHIGDSNPF